jgi:hypothetical protein
MWSRLAPRLCACYATGNKPNPGAYRRVGLITRKCAGFRLQWRNFWRVK